MGFLTQIKIRDLGKRRVTSASAEETEKAPGDDGVAGSWLTLTVNEITYNLEVGTSDKPSLNRYENSSQTEIYGLSEIDTCGIKVPTITLRGSFDMTLASGRKTFAALVKIGKTKGIKGITGVTNTSMWLNFINYYDDYYCNTSKTAGAEAVTNESTTTAAILSEIFVRVKSFNVPSTAQSNLAPWTLVLEETA